MIAAFILSIYQAFNMLWYHPFSSLPKEEYMKHWICTLGLLIGITGFNSAYGQAFQPLNRNAGYNDAAMASAPRVITAFPNPAQNQTTVVLAYRTRSHAVAEVLDYNGNLYKSYAFSPGTDQMTIDLGTLERGNYIVRIVEPGRRAEMVKLIKN